MKETKETNIFEVESSLEAIELNRIATGRKFCKIGERLIDFYDEEIERYKYENTKNIFIRFFKRNKFKNNILQIESRINSCIRATVAYCIRNNESENISKDDIIDDTKKILLEKISTFNKKSRENRDSKIININTNNENNKKEA